LANQGRPRRFLPADPRVEEPYRLTPQLAMRVAILGFVALGVFAVLFLRVWALQVLSGSNYLKEAKNNRVRTIMIDAPRGEILDSKGHELVGNVAGTSLEVWPADLPKNKRARVKELTALSVVAGMSVKQIEAKIAPDLDNPLAPVVLRRGIHQDQVIYLDERQLEFPGVDTPETSLRTYPYKSLLAQVLGYVGPITQNELPAAKKEHYQPQDVMGQAGIEQSYDRYLKGTDGTDELTVDSLGRPTSELQPVTQPIPGNNLRLTINIKLQQAAERALRTEIRSIRGNGAPYADGGAIVAMDPHSGAVLAMASYPTYQPSVFVGRDPAKLAPLENPQTAAADNYPSLDRAIDGLYPPGSTWKPVTALAAMEEGILTPSEDLQCTPQITIFQQVFKNWDPYVDQPMDLVQALAESCDTYFYQVGEGFYKMNALDGPTLQNWASRFGFGQPTGVDIGPESAGLLPTPDWLKKTYPAPKYPLIDRIWKPGYSVQLAIGQGDLEVTPLQMTRFYAMIANGGNLVTPHLAEDVEAPATDTPAGQSTPQVLRVLATQQPTPTGVNPSYLSAVQEGLYAGTHSVYGTSYGIFGQFPVAIAGKTGSAQKDITLPGYPNPVSLTQSWWCGYGPFDNPSIVVCAVIENGGEGASAAAPAALQVFESYFNKHNIPTTTHISD
jgi:penicillin-binding protein 2